MSFAFAELGSHPRLRSLILHDVVRTGKTLGSGSYGVIEEVAIPGAVCAAKMIHDFLLQEDPNWLTRESVETSVQKFLSECTLLSRLRHPHIVQFIGFWMEDDSQLHLVMEKMAFSLHDVLETDNKPGTLLPSRNLPLGLKCTILQDIARGLVYLHKQSPPVIHRDLSARNILLDSSMTAKIADLGMARNLPIRDGSVMTVAPGATVYMPPEALDTTSQYNTSIDVFSFGVIVIFILGERFPRNLKSSTFTDEKKEVLVARTEIQRREEYTRKIYATFPPSSPLIKLMELCLENNPKSRLSIDGVLDLLQETVGDMSEEKQQLYTKSKLELIQMLEKSLKESEILKKSLSWPGIEMPVPGGRKTKRRRKSKARPLTLGRVNKESISWPQDVVKTSLVSPKCVLTSLSLRPPPRIRSSLSVSELSHREEGPLVSDDVCHDFRSLTLIPERETSVHAAHEEKETWFKDISREEAVDLLCTCENGTFLCRPSSQATRVAGGSVHTHTIDIMCDGVKHIKVLMNDRLYYLPAGEDEFSSLEELIQHYTKHHLISSQTYLKFPLFS